MANLNPLNIVEGPMFALLGQSALSITPDVLPADATPFISAGGSWGGTWVNLGFLDETGATHGGLAPASNPVNTSQQRGSVTIVKGIAAQTVSFNMYEVTAQNLQRALGSGTITSTGTADDLQMTDDPVTYYALGIEAFGPNGKALRIIYPIVVPEITGNIVNRIGQVTTIPVRFTRAGGAAGQPRWRFLK